MDAVPIRNTAVPSHPTISPKRMPMAQCEPNSLTEQRHREGMTLGAAAASIHNRFSSVVCLSEFST